MANVPERVTIMYILESGGWAWTDSVTSSACALGRKRWTRRYRGTTGLSHVLFFSVKSSRYSTPMVRL